MKNKVEELLFDSSKQAVINASIVIDGDEKLFGEMMDVALSQTPKISSRATRSICEVILKDSTVAIPYFKKILSVLPTVRDESLVFNYLRIFALSPLPEDEDDLGWLTKICFDWLGTNVERIAIKVYALDILERTAEKYPEISPELIAIIKTQMPHLSPGFKSRGKKALKNLEAKHNLLH